MKISKLLKLRSLISYIFIDLYPFLNICKEKLRGLIILFMHMKWDINFIANVKWKSVFALADFSLELKWNIYFGQYISKTGNSSIINPISFHWQFFLYQNKCSLFRKNCLKIILKDIKSFLIQLHYSIKFHL